MNIQSLIVDFAREHRVSFFDAASAVTGIRPTDGVRINELDRLAVEAIRFDDEMMKDRLRAERAITEVKKVELTARDIEETPILAALEKLENYVDVSCWRMIQAAKRNHLHGYGPNQIEMAMEFVRIKNDGP